MSTVNPMAAAVLNALVSSGVGAVDISLYVLTPSVVIPPVVVAPPVPATEPFVIGVNEGGATDPASDPSLHPTFFPTMAQYNMKIMRLWQVGSFTVAAPDSLWIEAREYAAAGIDVCMVLNFQNSAVRCMVPNATDWTNYLNSIPSPAVTGVKYFEIGNELDSATYFADTPQNYVATLAIAYKILKAKGYIVVMGNIVTFGSSTPNNFYNYQMAKYGGFAFCDKIGMHAYYDNAADALAAYDRLIALAKSVGKTVMCTEVNLHMNKNNMPAWALQIQLLWAGLKLRGGIFLYFMLVGQNVTGAGPAGLLNADATPNLIIQNGLTLGLAA